MNSEKRVPRLRFSEFSDSWEQRKLIEVVEERHTFTKITEEYPRLSFTIEDGVISPEDRKTNKRDFLMKDEANKKFLVTEIGDIIYNPANVVFGAIHRNSLKNGCLSPIYRIFTTQHDSRFLECVVRSPIFISKLAQRTEGTVVKLKTLKPEAFLDMDVILAPTIGEQSKIADFICELDSFITLHQRKLEQVKTLKSVMIQKMFPRGGALVPEIRFSGFIDAWEQRKFAEVFDGLQNNTLSRADLNYESGTVKNVHYGDVLIKFGDYIDASETDLPYISDDTKAEKFKSSFLQDGDIIIADTAEDDTVGKCTEIQGSEGLKLLSGLHTIACRPKQKYGAKFLGYYINSSAYHNQLKPLMQGIKVTSISKSALQDTDMIMPKSLEEQTKIGEYFSSLDNLITLHQRKLETIKEYKNGLLQQMIV